MSSDDLNLLSDYSAIDFSKENTKNNKISSHVAQSSLRVNSATRKTSSLSFFNVFFDIVFWPFVFLRAKR